MNCREAEPLLHPYLDGELDLGASLRVEEHLAECEVCSRQYAAFQELRREIAGAELRFAPRRGLERRVLSARRRAVADFQPGWRYSGMAAVAASLLLAVLFFGPRFGGREDAADREVLDSHIRSLMAAHLVDVPSSDHHTVKPWFQGKLSFSPDVPDLSSHGFVLSGGRLDVFRRAPVAALVYKRRDHVINVFVVPANAADAPPRATTLQGYNLVRWTKAGMMYWAVSDLNAAELGALVDLMRR